MAYREYGFPARVTDGGTGNTYVYTAPTPTLATWAGWDTHTKMTAGQFLPGQTRRAADGSTYILDLDSTQEQYVTPVGESAGVTFQFPDETSIAIGAQYYIMNGSDFNASLIAFDSTFLLLMVPNSRVIATMVDKDGVLGWDFLYNTDTGALAVLITSPPPSASSSLTLGSNYQNANSYDVLLTVYLNITVNAGGNVKLGVGQATNPTQQTLITGLTVLGIVPIPIYIPSKYYALLSTTLTASIVGQMQMPI